MKHWHDVKKSAKSILLYSRPLAKKNTQPPCFEKVQNLKEKSRAKKPIREGKQGSSESLFMRKKLGGLVAPSDMHIFPSNTDPVFRTTKQR